MVLNSVAVSGVVAAVSLTISSGMGILAIIGRQADLAELLRYWPRFRQRGGVHPGPPWPAPGIRPDEIAPGHCVQPAGRSAVVLPPRGTFALVASSGGMADQGRSD